MLLEYIGYTLDESGVKIPESECKKKGVTYAVPVKPRSISSFRIPGRSDRRISTLAIFH